MRVPRASVVIGHQVPEVQILIHRFEVHFFVVLRPSWTGYCEEHMIASMAGFHFLAAVNGTGIAVGYPRDLHAAPPLVDEQGP